jgi:hydroxymethylbilane synthase
VPRVVLGNRTGAPALAQARAVLAELSEGWPDVSISQRTLQSRGGADELLHALQGGRIHIAVQSLDTLPLTLPDGLSVAAVTKRLEPRSALLARGAKSLSDVPKGAEVGVPTPRDRAFILAVRRDLKVKVFTGELGDALELLSTQELGALVWPSAPFIQLGQRERVATLLEPQQLPPAPGQGALALIVRDDDDLANDLAYTLQHRPSFDRVCAERAFARQMSSSAHHVGALASVTADGELHLFGAAARDEGDWMIQGEVVGDASEAEELGRELAQDVLEQLKARA